MFTTAVLALLALAPVAPQGPPGTKTIDLLPGPDGEYPREFIRTSDYVFLHTSDPLSDPSRPKAYSTDGTPEGTVQLPLPVDTDLIDPMGVAGDRVVFRFDTVNDSYRLGATDRETFTEITLPALPAGSWLPDTGAGTADFNGRVAFVVTSTGTFADELWETDGTEAGTRLIFDPSSIGEQWRIRRMQVVEDRLFVVAEDLATGAENRLYSTDGTPGPLLHEHGPSVEPILLLGSHAGRCVVGFGSYVGFVQVASIASGDGALLPLTSGYLSGVSFGVNLEDGVVIEFRVGSQPNFSMVRIDAEQPGAEILYGSGGNNISGPYAAGDKAVFFVRKLGPSQREAWFTDGSAQGTQMAGSVHSADSLASSKGGAVPGTNSFLFRVQGNPGIAPLPTGAAPAPTETRIYLATPESVTYMSELSYYGANYFFASPTEGLEVVGDRLITRGGNSNKGTEMVSIPLSYFGLPSVQSLQGGCTVAGASPPMLGASGTLRLGETTTFELTGSQPMAPVLWFRDVELGSTGLTGSCTVSVPNPILAHVGVADASGANGWAVALPQDPALLGFTFRLQALAVDQLGPAFGLGSLSDTLEFNFVP